METELIDYQNIGFGVAILILGISFLRWWSKKAFAQIEMSTKKAFELVDNANKRTEEAYKRVEFSQEKFLKFLEDTYEENTRTMQGLLSEFKEHIRLKNAAIEFMKEQHDLLKEELSTLKKIIENSELKIRRC